MHPAIVYLILAPLLALLSACSGTQEYDPTQDWSAEQFYTKATGALAARNYELAIEYFESLESRYPYGPYAIQAQLEVAFGYYKFDEPESAIAAADRFLRLHPTHKSADYAYYIRGLVNFERGMSGVDRAFRQDPAERDPGAARQAFFDFQTLATKWPQSRYIADARERMHYLRDNLARYELQVADYYMRRQAYLAAANRASIVVQRYATTPSLPHALVLQVRAYRALGIGDLAADSLKILELNFPDHEGLNALRNASKSG